MASQVVHHLKERGYSIAVIKSTKDSGLLLDEEGTDTHAYRLAGADVDDISGTDPLPVHAFDPEVVAGEAEPGMTIAYLDWHVTMNDDDSVILIAGIRDERAGELDEVMPALHEFLDEVERLAEDAALLGL